MGPFILLAGLVLAPGIARGEVAPPGAEGGEGSATGAAEALAEEPEGRFEWAPFPAVAGNTDIGFLFGVNGAVTRLEPGYAPYRYRLQVVATASVKEGPEGIDFPAHNYRLGADVPGLFGGRLRLTPEVAYERVVNAGYYGLAGLSSADPLGRRNLAAELEASGLSGRRYQYLWQGPRAILNTRWSLPGAPIELLAGVEYRYMLPEAYRGSLLDNDAGWFTSAGERILIGLGDHSLAMARVGALWDRRDSEVVPSRGTYVELSLRGGVGVPAGEEVFAYGGVTADLRLYVPLLDGQRLVLATRLLFDALFGDAPFYELQWVGTFTRHGLCDARAVRGCPEGRHGGMAKLHGVAELRSLFAPFRLFGMSMVFGMHLFASVGQIWSALEPLPPFRSSGPSATWGAGTGLLLRWGEAVMIRIETAYSPDATDGGLPVGIYFELDFAY